MEVVQTSHRLLEVMTSRDEKEHKIWGLCSVRFDDKGSVLLGFFIDGIGNGLIVSIS